MLAGVRSVAELAGGQGLDLPDNDSVPIDRVVKLGPGHRATVSEFGEEA